MMLYHCDVISRHNLYTCTLTNILVRKYELDLELQNVNVKYHVYMIVHTRILDSTP